MRWLIIVGLFLVSCAKTQLSNNCFTTVEVTANAWYVIDRCNRICFIQGNRWGILLDDSVCTKFIDLHFQPVEVRNGQ